MTSFMLQPPNPFNSNQPYTWKFWIKRFERFRVALFYLAAPKRVPIFLQQPVIAELKEMERAGVISRVTVPTE